MAGATNLASHDREAYRENINKYGYPAECPFNMYGVFGSELFSLNANDIATIELRSNTQISVEESECDGSGNTLSAWVFHRKEISHLKSGNAQIVSCEVNNLVNIWEAKVTFRAVESGSYQFELTNKSGKPIWCEYTVTLAAPAPKPTPETTKRSEEEVIVMVINRLQNLAQTSEAKEYVALLFPASSFHTEYLENLKAWVFAVYDFRFKASEGFEAAVWFQGDAIKYMDYLDEPLWLVYDDGTISPMAGGALMIETDIEKLNKDKMITGSTPAPSSTTGSTSQSNKFEIQNEVIATVLNHLSSLATTADAKQLLVDFQENVSDTHIGVIDSQGVGHEIEDYQGQDIDAYAIEFIFLDGENLHGVLGDEIIEVWHEHTVYFRLCNWLVELDGTVQSLNNNAHRVEFELMPSNSLVWTYPDLHQLHQFGISAEPDFFHQTVPREVLENPDWEPKELEERVIELARKYEKAHPYAEPNHVCRHMAVELWQVLRDNNITSLIVVGNTEEQEEWAKLFASDHAWLVVLGRNNLNLGVECTSGVVYSPSYMRAYEIDCELAYQEYGLSSPQWETAKAWYDRQYAEYEQHLEGYYHRSPVNLLTSALLFFIP